MTDTRFLPAAIPPGITIVDVYDDHADGFDRVGFFAYWAENNQWRGGSGTQAQVFHTRLSDFIARHNERGERVISRLDYELGRAWKRGMRFRHARQIADTSTPGNPDPEVCTITAVRQGCVYYRNSTGYRAYTPVNRFPASVKEWITPDA